MHTEHTATQTQSGRGEKKCSLITLLYKWKVCRQQIRVYRNVSQSHTHLKSVNRNSFPWNGSIRYQWDINLRHQRLRQQHPVCLSAHTGSVGSDLLDRGLRRRGWRGWSYNTGQVGRRTLPTLTQETLCHVLTTVNIFHSSGENAPELLEHKPIAAFVSGVSSSTVTPE